MKKYILLLQLLIPVVLFSQEYNFRSSLDFYLEDERLKDENQIQLFKTENFSILFDEDNSYYSLGLIGENYQRIRMKFISVIPELYNPMVLFVYGKSNVKDNICDFQGTINIKEIRLYTSLHLGVDHIYADSNLVVQGVIIADYFFYEDPKDNHSGYFHGQLIAGWYKDDSNIIKYDNIRSYWDSWCNNQFYGKWTDYKKGQSKICNWGHGRIPNSGDLDTGIGEFYPNKKYIKYGWDNFINLYNPDESIREKFWKVENYNWW